MSTRAVPAKSALALYLEAEVEAELRKADREILRYFGIAPTPQADGDPRPLTDGD